MGEGASEACGEIVVIATAETQYVRELVSSLCNAGHLPAAVLLGSRSERFVARFNSLLRVYHQLGAIEAARRIRRARRRDATPNPSAAPAVRDLAARFGFDLRTYPLGNSGALVIELSKRARAVCVLAGCGIVDRSIIRSARGGCINAHPALLPGLRGVDVIQWALAEGRQVGVTAHFVVESVDAGDLIESRKVLPQVGDTLVRFSARVISEQAKVLAEAAIAVSKGSARRQPHDLSKSTLRLAAPEHVWATAERRLSELSA